MRRTPLLVAGRSIVAMFFVRLLGLARRTHPGAVRATRHGSGNGQVAKGKAEKKRNETPVGHVGEV